MLFLEGIFNEPCEVNEYTLDHRFCLCQETGQIHKFIDIELTKVVPTELWIYDCEDFLQDKIMKNSTKFSLDNVNVVYINKIKDEVPYYQSLENVEKLLTF